MKGQVSNNKPPFIGYGKQNELFKNFLRKWTGLSKNVIEREEYDDNVFLSRDLTYTGVQEIFDAGWEAAFKAINGLRK